MAAGDKRMIDPTAILALVSDLYGQIGRLADENKALREALETKQEPGT